MESCGVVKRGEELVHFSKRCVVSFKVYVLRGCSEALLNEGKVKINFYVYIIL